MAPDDRKHIEHWNVQTSALWNQERYARAVKLARTIRKHASRLDQDSTKPAHFVSYQIDGDGYFSFRCGGGLAARITVKYSTRQREARKNNRRALLALIRGVETLPIAARYWETAVFSVVKE
jgi:hypothetical protein